MVVDSFIWSYDDVSGTMQYRMSLSMGLSDMVLLVYLVCGTPYPPVGGYFMDEEGYHTDYLSLPHTPYGGIICTIWGEGAPTVGAKDNQIPGTSWSNQ